MLYKTKRIVELEQLQAANRSAAFYRTTPLLNVQGARSVRRGMAGLGGFPARRKGSRVQSGPNGGAIRVSISQQNPVRVFVSHAFEPSDDYHRVFEYLESSHNFYYRNCSDPEQRGTGEREKLKDELRRQIALAEVVIVPSGQYATQREWIDFQLNCAKGLDKPVIVLEAFGVKQKMPVQLEALADEIVGWNERDIADSIRRQARHEDTTRWDTIDFKLD
jgi:hypothetical protein